MARKQKPKYRPGIDDPPRLVRVRHWMLWVVAASMGLVSALIGRKRSD